jgi:predicted phage terminase large subunit-like protein
MYLRVNNPTYKQEARHYRVTGRRLLLAQKFLHVVQPAKWRDRLLEGAYGSSFIVDQERVISIEPDGEEEVFGLTTESGNYVVWGLASSNSGQYSQSPAPVGGGIIPAAWWKLWESSAGTFPPVDFICASLDGAFTAREENDPSALTIWGVWTETHEGVKRRRVVLMSAWRKFLPFSGERATCDRRPNESLQGWRWRTRPHWGLMEWVKDTCEERRANVLLIEAKGPGISAAQELRNRFGDLSFGIQLVQPKGDKIARVLACQPLFSQGVVYAPDREYAQLVIDELEVFPKGARDDLCDSSSQALKWLRDSGLLASDEEVVETMRRSIMHHSPQKPIYPC